MHALISIPIILVVIRRCSISRKCLVFMYPDFVPLDLSISYYVPFGSGYLCNYVFIFILLFMFTEFVASVRAGHAPEVNVSLERFPTLSPSTISTPPTMLISTLFPCLYNLGAERNHINSFLEHLLRQRPLHLRAEHLVSRFSDTAAIGMHCHLFKVCTDFHSPSSSSRGRCLFP